jgi:hypothetical protein
VPESSLKNRQSFNAFPPVRPGKPICSLIAIHPGCWQRRGKNRDTQRNQSPDYSSTWLVRAIAAAKARQAAPCTAEMKAIGKEGLIY